MKKLVLACAVLSSALMPVTYADMIAEESQKIKHAAQAAERIFEAVDKVDVEFKPVKAINVSGEREVVSFNKEEEPTDIEGVTLARDERPLQFFFDKSRKHATVSQSPHPEVIKILEITDAWIKAFKASSSHECTKQLVVMMRFSSPVLMKISFAKTGEDEELEVTAHVVIEGFFEKEGTPEYLAHFMRAVLQKDPAPTSWGKTLLRGLGTIAGISGVGYLCAAYVNGWAPFTHGIGDAGDMLFKEKVFKALYAELISSTPLRRPAYDSYKAGNVVVHYGCNLDPSAAYGTDPVHIFIVTNLQQLLDAGWDGRGEYTYTDVRKEFLSGVRKGFMVFALDERTQDRYFAKMYPEVCWKNGGHGKYADLKTAQLFEEKTEDDLVETIKKIVSYQLQNTFNLKRHEDSPGRYVWQKA